MSRTKTTMWRWVTNCPQSELDESLFATKKSYNASVSRNGFPLLDGDRPVVAQVRYGGEKICGSDKVYYGIYIPFEEWIDWYFKVNKIERNPETEDRALKTSQERIGEFTSSLIYHLKMEQLQRSEKVRKTKITRRIRTSSKKRRKNS